jgi:zinc/manganese transport system substrate-binding protein
MSRLTPRALAVLCALLAAVVAAGCGGSGLAGTPHGKFEVVAAENFWGSIATQLAGAKANVQSIIVNPGTDPHSYEPTAQDARTMARAKLAIVNGIGYDNWATKLLEAGPLSGRVVLNVGDLAGLKEGDNPHQWYSPANLHRVIDQIVADYDRLDPADARYFAQRKQSLQSSGLAEYNKLRRQIRTRYAGVPVGYSESIFQPLGEDLGLKLLTPPSFAKAIAEGAEVTVQDKQTVDAQLQEHKVKVWVFNSQNVTPDIKRLNQIATAQQIPIATVTETLSPASASFEQWQGAELRGLLRALRQATGR